MSAHQHSQTDEDTRVSLLFQRAQLAASNNKTDEARRLLKAVMRHDPDNDQALLALVYLAEDGQASLTYLARLLDTTPHHPQARTAIRWARRQTPTSYPRDTLSPPPKSRTAARRPHRMIFGLTMLAILLGLGVIWQLAQPPTVSVQAEAPWAVTPMSLTTRSSRTFTEVVQLSIPRFTQTPTPEPTPSPTPTPTPTPTPDSAWVPVLGQPQIYNLSCESRSATDLAAFWDVSISEVEFLAALGRSDNPHQGFVGDVRSPPGSVPPDGYGVYAEPVAATLQDYGLDARAVYDLGLDGLRAELLAGRPVLVWATYGMEVQEPLEWTSSDGRVSTVVPFMHTFLATGFDAHGVFVLDAYDATVQHYAFETFLRAWSLFDQMAIVVFGSLP